MSKKTTLDIALTQLGVKEATGKNDGIPAERYMSGDEFPWCAGFVVWCNNHSDDEDLTPTLKDDYSLRRVQTFEDRMKERGKFFTDRGAVRANDIVFFKQRGNSDPGAGRHMGVVRDVYGPNILASTKRLRTVEGNTSNAVMEREYFIGDDYITGFARINGGAPVEALKEGAKKTVEPHPLLVYVAAPYRADTPYGVEKNIQNARRWGAIIASLGAYPVIPHSNTSHFGGLAPDEVFLKGTMRLMHACDLAVFLYEDRGGKEHFSSGVRAEKDAWEADENAGNDAVLDKDLNDAEAREAIRAFLKGPGR